MPKAGYASLSRPTVLTKIILEREMNYKVNITEEDAFHIIVQSLREKVTKYSGYGYEIYLPHMIRNYLNQSGLTGPIRQDGYINKLSPFFYNAS